LLGESVPGYEIEGELGRGGMGVVYRARQISLNRTVALKMLLHAGHASPEEQQRFRTEAEAVACLRHPHIVQIYEVGEHQGLPYFSLEFCEGGSLAARLQGTPLPPVAAAELVATLARAMHAAHQRGIIHRDLKPGNVLLQRKATTDSTDDTDKKKIVPSSSVSSVASVSSVVDLVPKITDFGLAKRLDQPGQTRSGAVLGTPSYMAPEQAAGKKEVGPAADIYALGAILYECLTGRPPFKTAAPLDTLMQVLSDEPVPPSRLSGKVSRDLETICLKCLQKEPPKRYDSAADLAADLERFLDGRPIRARPLGPAGRAWRWCRRNPGVAGALAALLVSLLLGSALASFYAVRADRQRHQAEQARAAETVRADAERQAKRQAEQARDYAQWLVYTGLIALAQREWQDNDVAHARDLLDDCRWDFRRWEHAYLRRTCAGSRQTLQAPDKHLINAVAFSPDGRLLASAAADRTVRVWDLAAGRTVLTLRGHQDSVACVAFSPDGKRLATASQDKTVKLWDAGSGRALRTLKGHLWQVWGIAFSPDGRRLASAAGDRTVRIWDLATGRTLLTLKGHQYPVTCVAFSPDGKRLASGSSDQTVRLWDAATGRETHTLRGHAFAVARVAFSPDGTRLASGSWDNTVRLWDPVTGRVERTLTGHTHWVLGLAFSPDGRRLATGSMDRTVKVWELDTQKVFTFRGHTNTVYTVAFAPDGLALASGSFDRTIKVWDTSTAPECLVLEGRAGPLFGVAFSPDGRRLAAACWDHLVKVWDVTTGQETLALGGHSGRVYSVAFSAAGGLLASGSADRTVKVWEAATGRLVATLRGHGAAVTSVAFRRDGKRLASASVDGTVKVWAVRRGQALLTLKGHRGSVLAVAVSPDGRTLASGGADRTVRTWDAVTGQPLHTRTGHVGAVAALAFSANGALASASADRTVRLWDAQGQETLTLRGHTQAVSAVAFSPDGTRLASASADQTVKVWGTTTRQEVLTLKGANKGYRGIAFSPDGRLLAGAALDRTVKVWTAATEAEVLVLKGATEPVTSVAFSPDGRRLIARCRPEVRAWDTTTGAEVVPCTDPPPADGQLRALSPDRRLEASAAGTTVAVRRLSAPGADPAEGRRQQRKLRAWHRQQADRAEGERHWFAAAFHLRQLCAAEPGNAVYRVRLGLLTAQQHAQVGNWPAAARAAARTTLGAADLHALVVAARLSLATGEARGYQRARAAMRDPLGPATDLDLAERVVRTWILAPQAESDWTEALRWAEQAAARRSDGYRQLTTLGGVLLRAGRARAAVKPLQQAWRLRDGPRASEAALLLALVYQRLGQVKEARGWLKRAGSGHERLSEAVQAGRLASAGLAGPLALLGALHGPAPDPDLQRLGWEAWLELHLLRAEVELLLQPAAPLHEGPARRVGGQGKSLR
jgi:WD40 repeat protein/serine/threonine protein kinase